MFGVAGVVLFGLKYRMNPWEFYISCMAAALVGIIVIPAFSPNYYVPNNSSLNSLVFNPDSFIEIEEETSIENLEYIINYGEVSTGIIVEYQLGKTVVTVPEYLITNAEIKKASYWAEKISEDMVKRILVAVNKE